MQKSLLIAFLVVLASACSAPKDAAPVADGNADLALAAAAPASAPAPAADKVMSEDPVVFAVVGDFGSGDSHEQSVADLINGWSDVQFIVSLGDNNYGNFDLATYQTRVCDYYPTWVKPAAKGGNCKAKQNNFYPTPGNHDCHVDATTSNGACTTTGQFYTPYAAFFDWPGKPADKQAAAFRDADMYYSFARSSSNTTVQFYAFNANCADTDADACNANNGSHGCSNDGCAGNYQAMADKIVASQKASSADWSFVYLHQTPYSLAGDAPCGGIAALDFAGAAYNNKNGSPLSAVLAAHSHNYQRFATTTNTQVPFIVNGTGGTGLDTCPANCKTPAGTAGALCYPGPSHNNHHGAMRVSATAKQAVIEYFTTHSAGPVDTCVLTRNPDGSQKMTCAASVHKKATTCSTGS